MVRIFAHITSPESRHILEPLAKRHGWSVAADPSLLGSSGFALEFEDDRLQLRDLERPKMSAVSVDFLSPSLRHRRSHGLSKTQVFAKAIGIAHRPLQGAALTVIDATAGLGVDAFIMACMGCEVTSLERSAVVYELLADGYRRALQDRELGAWLKTRLRFVHAEAERFMASLDDTRKPDVVYLDPMYPHIEGKSALPKKEMQSLRRLLEEQDRESDARLFAAAMATARERVVVKRPNEALPIAPGVTHAFIGKTARYDLYAVR